MTGAGGIAIYSYCRTIQQKRPVSFGQAFFDLCNTVERFWESKIQKGY